MYKTLDSYDFKGKYVLVRIDINSEIIDGKVSFSDRFLAPLPTIKELMKRKAKVVLLAHQGRPGEKDFTDLSQHAAILNKYVKVKFVKDVIGSKAIGAIRTLKDGECLLLNNVRTLRDEFNTSRNNKFVKTLAPLFDYYVNDAFSVSHREQASVTGFPKVIKSCIGRALEKELINLSKLHPESSVFILGGAKAEDVALLMKHRKVLTTGVPALIALIAKGYDLGLENDRRNSKAMPEIKKNIKHITTPIDLAMNEHGKRKEITRRMLPSKYRALDIGTGTIKQYVKTIMSAKSVFLKGTPGYSEIKGFEKGTKEILKAMSRTKAFTVIGGGHTTTALRRFKINPKSIDYISLSGGALVYYLAGKKLPGLEVLK